MWHHYCRSHNLFHVIAALFLYRSGCSMRSHSRVSPSGSPETHWTRSIEFDTDHLLEFPLVCFGYYRTDPLRHPWFLFRTLRIDDATFAPPHSIAVAVGKLKHLLVHCISSRKQIDDIVVDGAIWWKVGGWFPRSFPLLESLDCAYEEVFVRFLAVPNALPSLKSLDSVWYSSVEFQQEHSPHLSNVGQLEIVRDVQLRSLSLFDHHFLLGQLQKQLRVLRHSIGNLTTDFCSGRFCSLKELVLEFGHAFVLGSSPARDCHFPCLRVLGMSFYESREGDGDLFSCWNCPVVQKLRLQRFRDVGRFIFQRIRALREHLTHLVLGKGDLCFAPALPVGEWTKLEVLKLNLPLVGDRSDYFNRESSFPALRDFYGFGEDVEHLRLRGARRLEVVDIERGCVNLSFLCQFSTWRFLRKLSIGYCNVVSLPETTFEPFPVLEKMELIAIEVCKDMSDFESTRSSFQPFLQKLLAVGCNSLTTLHLDQLGELDLRSHLPLSLRSQLRVLFLWNAGAKNILLPDGFFTDCEFTCLVSLHLLHCEVVHGGVWNASFPLLEVLSLDECVLDLRDLAFSQPTNFPSLSNLHITGCDTCRFSLLTGTGWAILPSLARVTFEGCGELRDEIFCPPTRVPAAQVIRLWDCCRITKMGWDEHKCLKTDADAAGW